jgi:hypothetical protein
MFESATSFNQSLCWTVPQVVNVDGMFCESPGSFNESCSFLGSLGYPEWSQECAEPTSAPVPAVPTPSPTNMEDPTCDLRAALSGMKGWLYGVGLGLLALDLILTACLARLVPNSAGIPRHTVWFEGFVKFLSDVNMVVLIMLSITIAYHIEGRGGR